VPFKKPRQQPNFALLKGTLAQVKKTEDPLYQTIQEIISKLTQFQGITVTQIGDVNNSINDVTTIVNGDRQLIATIVGVLQQQTFVTKNDETLYLPVSWQLVAGSGITFDTSTTNQLKINSSSSSGGYAPMSTGAEPLEIMSDGAGKVLMTEYTP
jgi:hypothetical protein